MTLFLSPQHIRKLGIVVGKGDRPGQIRDLCQSQGIPFFLLAIENQTPHHVVASHHHRWVRIGALAQALDVLKEEGVSHAVLAGSIQRPSLLDLRPDFKASRLLARIGMKAFGDDGLLSAIVSVIEEADIIVVGAHELLKSLTVSDFSLGCMPSDQQQADIQRGIKVLDALSDTDVGQAVVVQEGIVLAIEAAEGTDRMLERCSSVRSRISGLSGRGFGQTIKNFPGASCRHAYGGANNAP